MNFKVLQIENTINNDLIYQISTKTLYSGVENHKKIILILDYISNKYLENFKCIDEGFYWETRDEDLLEKTFEKHSNLIDSFSSSLEMIPSKKDETLEDYLIRISDVTKRNTEDNLPELTIEQENEFKKIKIELEHDAVFFENDKTNLPPEVESQFLDYITNFENKFKDVKTTTVYEKIGKPSYIEANLLNNLEIELELERIETIMANHNLVLDVLCDYENEERLIYSFITEQLFNEEISDIDIPGMITNFIYEEFHPNNESDIKKGCFDFINMFLDIDNDLYIRYHYEDATNHIELNNFRNLFQVLKIENFKFHSLIINEENAKANFYIDFHGIFKQTDLKINYSGNGEIIFKHEYGYWNVQNVSLPIAN
jgi:hypothetical protein